MSLSHNLFNLLSTLVTLYSIACFIRVIITWFPNAQYSAFGRFLSAVCDPYLNIFRGIKFLRTSTLDFTPILSLGILAGVSGILANLARYGKFSLGAIIASVIEMIGGAATSIIGLIIIMALIRLVAILVSPSSRFELWSALDRILYPILTPVAALFSNAARFVWRTSLIIGTLFFIVLNVLINIVTGLLAGIFRGLPF
jgi:YggT family protein